MTEPTKTFYIEMTKRIVVPMEAETVQEALELAVNDDSGFDGAWERAEIEAQDITDGVELS